MSVLITGSAGLVGHALRRALEADGEDVIAVDREPSSFDGVPQVVADIADAAAVESVIATHRPTAVAHCGGVSGPMVLADLPRTIVEVNVGGTANLLESARRHGVRRFVYCSSIAAYGSTPPGPVGEDTALSPRDVYGASKAAAEQLVNGYRHQHGPAGVSLRISTVFGPRRRTSCLIRELLDDAAAGRETRVPVAGDAPQQYVHVDDVAAAVRAALTASDAGGPYNVSGGDVRTVREVIDAVRGVDPRVRAEPLPDDPADAARWPGRLDLAAAARDLGWRPVRDFTEAVREMRAVGPVTGGVTDA